MNPDILNQYLLAARKNNCMALVLKLSDAEIHATFGPEIASEEPTKDLPESGGWKSWEQSRTLDLPFESDEPEPELPPINPDEDKA